VAQHTHEQCPCHCTTALWCGRMAAGGSSQSYGACIAWCSLSRRAVCLASRRSVTRRAPRAFFFFFFYILGLTRVGGGAGRGRWGRSRLGGPSPGTLTSQAVQGTGRQAGELGGRPPYRLFLLNTAPRVPRTRPGAAADRGAQAFWHRPAPRHDGQLAQDVYGRRRS
jgi:hypothetical protein